MKFDNVRKIYDRLLAIETADPTLVVFDVLFLMIMIFIDCSLLYVLNLGAES